MHRFRRILALLAATMVFGFAAGCGGDRQSGTTAAPTVRPFEPVAGDQWLGNAICYGPHRDGQRPGGASPSAAEVREDLQLMLPHWRLMRVYGAVGVSETILEVIRADSLPMKVMLGVWIDVEERRGADGVVTETFGEAAVANRREVAAAIRLAESYPGIVLAVSVGNETQVSWSAHRSPLDILIGHVRNVRAGVSVPVTVADDFNFWNRPESRELALELDFLTMHAHPLWNGQQLDEAVPWLEEQLEVVQAVNPGRLIVLGETGWATTVHDQGEQAELIKGMAGETEQKVFHDQIRAWAETRRQTVFSFEAFDENWKGGPHPNEVEKHWGLFRADRSPKQAVAAGVGTP